jgi:hypothetical protein
LLYYFFTGETTSNTTQREGEKTEGIMGKERKRREEERNLG